MNTKLKLIAAAAAAFACTQAQAFGPTITPDVTIYIAGGSAQGGAFLAFAEKMMTSNIDVYTDDTTCAAQGANYRAVFGTAAATLADGTAMPPSIAGKKLFIEYANNGGTFKNGIDGPVRAHAVDFQTYLGNSVTTGCAASFSSGPTYHVTTATTTANFIPLLGLSDEEIPLFSGVNLPAGSAAITSAELSKIAAQGLYENVFSVAENNVLAAQKTNFSKAEVTAIFAGTYTNWNQLIGDVGTFNGVALPAGKITIIDRAAGSGSKAAFNQYFLNNPGSSASSGALSPRNASGTIGNCGTPATHGSGSYDEVTGGDCSESSNGNVKKGLNAANTAGARAVGILGLEFQPASGTDSYVFGHLNGVVVDGVSSRTCGNAVATLFEPANVVSGAHDLFFTNSLNYRTASVGGAPFFGDGSVSSDFITAFSVTASDPATEVSVPGVMLDPVVVGAPAGSPWDACITKGTHNLTSTAPLQLQY